MIPFIDLATQQKRIRVQLEKRTHNILDHGQYILGPEVRELEEKLNDYCQVKHSILAASGTDALLAALYALDIGAGDEVIIPDFSFFATAEVVLMAGATPVFVDINAHDYNINPQLIEAKITAKTKAIMPVSLYGQIYDVEAIHAIAEKHHLPIIEDGAQSFGASYKGKKSCTLTLIGCTSFFPAKPLGCYGDGGACFSNDDQVAQKLRMALNHGQEKRYHHVSLGFNGRFDTLQAAVLLEKLPFFEEEIHTRQEIAHRYEQGLKDILPTPQVKANHISAWAQYTIEHDNRDAFADRLKEFGVPTSVHYPSALSAQPVVKKYHPDVQSHPIAQEKGARVISLPMHAYLEKSTQEKIIEAVKKTF